MIIIEVLTAMIVFTVIVCIVVATLRAYRRSGK